MHHACEHRGATIYPILQRRRSDILIEKEQNSKIRWNHSGNATDGMKTAKTRHSRATQQSMTRGYYRKRMGQIHPNINN